MNTFINIINTQLYKLHKINSTLIPMDKISINPNIYFSDKYTKITKFIEEQIKISKKEQENLILKCKEIETEIKIKSKNLNIKYLEVQEFTNLYLKYEYLCNENNKIKIMEKNLEKEIDLWISKIYILHNEIYQEEFVCPDKQISQNYLINIKKLHEQLKEEKSKKEKKRFEMIKIIKNLKKRLNKKDEISYTDKISIIEEKYYEYTTLCKHREEEIKNLKIQIIGKEDLLNKSISSGFKSEENLLFIPKPSENNIEENELFKPSIDEYTSKENQPNKILKDESANNKILSDDFTNNKILSDEYKVKEFSNSLSDEYIFYLKNRLLFLEEEYKRQLDEIYKNHANILKDLLILFGMKDEFYEKNDAGILNLKNRIKDLEEKKDTFLEINNLIEKRYNLLESMNEFEKIASDPKRLFKSSFQLNREEKFRKYAYPSLLKIEEEIRSKIEEYNKMYGEFIKNGEVYKNVIREEIEGRIINKTVFINKYDSPYKKKKLP
ncbi:protein regulator of cytokinesis 1 (Prc1) [Vairimorpha necatrix]|uniref:Protein regulator of cytokinesis 1 (Prc1) n=1 Tax=Vairimorpha necatrix TaxID=6039 RepID=A0AAX4JBY4_9MICR